MDADQHDKYLDVTTTYSYDPRDRLASVSKTDTSSGNPIGSESYTHDANNNVIDQEVNDVATSFVYDRNQLLSCTSQGITSGYNYDPYGRLDTITAGGQVIESYRYDGFDRIVRHTTTDTGGTAATAYTYDPLDRTASRTENVGGADEQATQFAYLGLSEQLITETDPATGQLERSYQYSPWGQRLSQTKHDGTATEDSFYGPPRHFIPGTNAIESLNARYRRAVRARGHFPTEQAALKCLYLVTGSLDPTGRGRARWITRWKPALNAFVITFEGRLTPSTNN